MFHKYAIRTSDSKPMVKVKDFTLNYDASNQLNCNVIKDMAISDEQHYIKIVERPQIKQYLKRRQISTLPSSIQCSWPTLGGTVRQQMTPANRDKYYPDSLLFVSAGFLSWVSLQRLN